MKTFSIKCKAKNLLATLVLVVACDPGPEPDDGGDDEGSTTGTESDDGSDGDSGGTGSDDDGDESGTVTGDALDLGDDGSGGGGDCPSECPETTTLECGEGERCVPYPMAPVCEVCP